MSISIYDFCLCTARYDKNHVSCWAELQVMDWMTGKSKESTKQRLETVLLLEPTAFTYTKKFSTAQQHVRVITESTSHFNLI
jgi:hypothetical protein